MDYIVFTYIATIGFWLLVAFCTIAVMAYVYVYIQYYRWDKLERKEANIMNSVYKAVQDAIKEANEVDVLLTQNIEENE